MNKEELRKLIQSNKDETTLNALWELYELKFCKPNISTNTIPTNPCSSGNNFIYDKSITTATL